MKKRLAVVGVIATLVVALFAVVALASNGEIYFSSDKNGQSRVTNVNEGQQVWICVYDPDQNIDCDLRDKIWTDIKVFDPKTGAYIVWNSYGPGSSGTSGYGPHYTGRSGDTSNGNYLEETGADTGLFVSNKPYQVGTRVNYNTPEDNTHVVGLLSSGSPIDFQWGNYEYENADATGGTVNPLTYADKRGWFSPNGTANPAFNVGLMNPAGLIAALPGGDWTATGDYLVGRFQNLDTLVGMYQDPVDPSDVAITMAKITRTEATISWDQSVYKDQRGAATITVTDPDENLNCNAVEYVPVWVIVNPGSWNVQTGSPVNSFCMLERTGGVNPGTGAVLNQPVRWYNIYNSGLDPANTSAVYPNNQQATSTGAYYLQYPVGGNVVQFATADSNGYCRVMFYAQETGVSTGVFQLNLNDLAKDLGFTTLNVHDVLAAYYLDPNDPSDFHIATAYIGENVASITSFTDATRTPKSTYDLGRDPVYVQVIDANANVDPCCPEQVVVALCDPHGTDDAEWLIADETSSNSPIFFTNAGTQLLPVWDALGVGLADSIGGYQLQLDNWKLEAFNNDTLYARYNDVYYTNDINGMLGLGDANTGTAFPPQIDRVRVANDVSFAQVKVNDTEVTDGSKTNMYFLDRQGNRVSGYVNSDCVFVEVVDPDQNEDSYRRERIDGYWDGGQNYPFGPLPLNTFECPVSGMSSQTHPVNALLGDTNIFNNSPAQPLGYTPATNSLTKTDFPLATGDVYGAPMLYVINPRSGRWAAVDLLETGVATGDFVSVTCIDLTSVYTCVPSLGVQPGDTVLAVYEDPSNHSDSAWVSIKVGIGGGVTPPSQKSTTTFCDAQGNAVSTYTDADTAYVKVVDPSHSGATSLLGAVAIGDQTYDLAPLSGAQSDTFITPAISMSDLGAAAGDTLTATYTDPTDPTDTSSATADVTASALSVTDFYAGPNPVSTTTDFAYHGSGVASDFSVSVYNLAGQLVWNDEETNVSKITWDGTNLNGAALANGAYIYVVMATDGTNTFNGKGTVFIKK